jgi:hypothetical protein
VGERKELIVVKENVIVALVSVAVGLVVGFLAWEASSTWSSSQPGPAMMNNSSMMGSMSGQMMGPGMMNGVMGGMMQGMSQGMMGQGMMNHMGSQEMGEHMAQCQQMMAMMQQHMRAAPPSPNESK